MLSRTATGPRKIEASIALTFLEFTTVLTLTDAMIQDVITQTVDGTPAAAKISGAKIGYFVNDITPTNQTVLADLTLPAAGGYAEAAVTWSSISENAEGGFRTVGSLASFSGDPDNPETAFGAYLVDTTGAILLAVDRFDDEVQLADGTDQLNMVPEYRVGAPDDGEVVVI